MRLTTEYREKAKGLSGSKEYYLVCALEFTQEEQTIIQERGLYDYELYLPASSPPPTRGYDFVSMLMRVVGVALVPIGLVVSCAAGLTQSGGPLSGLALAAALGGIVLFFVGKNRDNEATKRLEEDFRGYKLRYLMPRVTFQAYAPSITEAQEHEAHIRGALAFLAEKLRASTAVPEKNTYEI
jgi:hypothetical protein